MIFNLSREQYWSMFITFMVTILIILLLFLLGFRTPLPLPEEKGVVIEVGGGGGGDLSSLGENLEEYKLPPQPMPSSAEQILTQDQEETDYTVPEVKQHAQPTSNEQVPTSTQPTQPQIDNRLLQAASMLGKGKSEGSGSRDEGKGTGSGGGLGQGTGTGIGMGSGPSYSLKGRTAKKLPLPSDANEEGIVVVTIKVDKSGKVVEAEPGAIGTTTSSKILWEKAKMAALEAQFNIVDDPDAPEFQKGTIRYTFITRK